MPVIHAYRAETLRKTTLQTWVSAHSRIEMMVDAAKTERRGIVAVKRDIGKGPESQWLDVGHVAQK